MSITAELDELLLSLEAATRRAQARGHGEHQSPTQPVVAAYIAHRLMECRADQEQLAALEQELDGWLTGHRMGSLRTLMRKQVESHRASLRRLAASPGLVYTRTTPEHGEQALHEPLSW